MPYSNLKALTIKVLDAFKVADVKMRFDNRDRVLLYHSVESGKSGFPYSVSRESFEAHLGFLLSRFRIVSLEEMFGTTSNVPRVALTFDDAYDDFLMNVYPLLLRTRAPATVFVPTVFVEERRRHLEKEVLGYSKEHLSWEQMREMSASGLVKFESHTHSHRDSVRYIEMLEDDVKLSIRLLEKNLNRRPRYFAYPFGTCNAHTHEVVLRCGFDKIFTIESSHVREGKVQGRFDVRRMNERVDYFKLTVAGVNSNHLWKFWAYLSGRKG